MREQLANDISDVIDEFGPQLYENFNKVSTAGCLSGLVSLLLQTRLLPVRVRCPRRVVRPDVHTQVRCGRLVCLVSSHALA